MTVQLVRGARDAPPDDGRDRAARTLAEARRGSTGALAAMYDAHHSRVRQLARRLLGNDASAEDLVQEIFELLPRALRRF